ncbi:unnamed protein product [Alternaria burnsii]|nr:unnamed protein product [Alternaria burnsii]
MLADSWRIWIIKGEDERTELELFRLQGQELHTQPGLSSSKLPIPTRRLLPGDTSSDETLQTLQNWIETCVEHHETCAGHKINKLPKRVLEIDGEHVYLREHSKTTAMYACLSHCWGPSGPALKLDKTTSSDLFDGILIDRLPKTFADAVRLCARLNLRFLWIDACCIMQDDEDDWKEAAATMAIIYERAHLTIAATWASNSDCGLFASDRKRYRARKLTAHELYIQKIRGFFPPPDEPGYPEFPLLSRAWVYQERLLSSRMVHFSKDQIYWQCPTRFISENGMTFKDVYTWTNTSSLELFEVIEDPVDRWHKLVNMYSGLDLTYASDRLPAIAAIVEREMRLRLDDVYIAGMWKKSLLSDLAWRSFESWTPPARCPQIRSPTWAWPSSQMHVCWLSGSLEPCLRLMDLSYTYVGPAHVGEVTHASISLEGHTYTIRLKEAIRWDLFESVPCFEIVPRSTSDVRLKTWSARMDFDWSTGDRPVRVGDDFVVLPTSLSEEASYMGLILKEVTNGVFERIGTIEIEAVSQSEMTTLQRTWRICEFVEALPIRQVKII